MMNPWQLSIDPLRSEARELEKSLVTDLSCGLSSTEAQERLKEYGPNQLVEKKGPSAFSIFLGQFNNFIIWVLLGAAIISGFLTEWLMHWL